MRTKAQITIWCGYITIIWAFLLFRRIVANLNSKVFLFFRHKNKMFVSWPMKPYVLTLCMCLEGVVAALWENLQLPALSLPC